MSAQTASGRPMLRWWTLLAIGLALAATGAAAILLPTVSTFAVGVVLGGGLILIGVVKTAQAFEEKELPSFLSKLFLGAIELVGGVLLYFNPLKGAVAVKLLIAIVFLAGGASQIATAWRMRPQNGWRWLLAGGALSIAASVGLVAGYRHIRDLEAGVIAGVAMLFSGVVYCLIAIAVRRAQRTPAPR